MSHRPLSILRSARPRAVHLLLGRKGQQSEADGVVTLYGVRRDV
jgi:hypothetical protein